MTTRDVLSAAIYVGILTLGALPFSAAAAATPGPQSQSCYTDPETVASELIADPITGVPYAFLELRWSSTCQTNWARLTSLTNHQMILAWLEKVDDSSQYNSYMGGSNVTSIYTDALYAPESYSVKACGHVILSDGTIEVECTDFR